MRKHQQHSNIKHQSEFNHLSLYEDLIPMSNCINGHPQINTGISKKHLHRNPSINSAFNKNHSSYRLFQDKKYPFNIYRLYESIADKITEKNSTYYISNSIKGSQSAHRYFSKEYSKRINLNHKNIVKICGVYLQTPKTHTKQEIAYPAILTQHIQPITSLGFVKNDKVVFQIILDWISGIEYLHREYEGLFFVLSASMLGYKTTKDNQYVGKVWLNEDFSKNKGQSIKIRSDNPEECYQKIILSIIETLTRPFIKDKNNIFSSNNFQQMKHHITASLPKNKQHHHFINVTVENQHCHKNSDPQNPNDEYYCQSNKNKERKSSREGSRKISVYSGQKKYEKQENKHSNHSQPKEIKILKLGAKSRNKSITLKGKEAENSKDSKTPSSNRQSIKYRQIKDLNYKIISPHNHTVANKCQWKSNQPLKDPFEIKPQNKVIQNQQQNKEKIVSSPNPESISIRKVVNPVLSSHQLHIDPKKMIQKATKQQLQVNSQEKQNLLSVTKDKHAQYFANKSSASLFQTFIPSKKHQSTPSSLTNEIDTSKGNEIKKQISKNDLIRFQSYYDRIITQPLLPQKKTGQSSEETTPLFKYDKSLSKITPIKPLLKIEAIDHELSTDAKQYKQLVQDNLTGNFDALKLNYQEWKQIYEFNNQQQQLSEEYLEEQKNISMEISERDNEQSSQSFVQEQENRNYSEVEDQSLQRLKRNTGPIEIVESYITVLDESNKSLSNNKKIVIDESFIVKGKNKPEELSPTIKRQKRQQWFKASPTSSQNECMSPINKLGSKQLSRFPIAQEDSDIDQTKIFLFNPSNKRHVSCKFSD